VPASYLELEPGENVILVAKYHWIGILPIIISTVLVLASISYALGWIAANPNRLPLGDGAVASMLLILAILTGLILVAAYLIFRQNRIILTNRYYIQVNQRGLFGRTISKLTLDEIQDVRGSKHGVLQTLLNYGEILIETAGQEINFFFRPVGRPFNLAEQINDAHQHFSPTHIPGAPASPPPEPKS
jgi:uncharacterized membrane protein YdbT with pleckstrin-like domain